MADPDDDVSAYQNSHTDSNHKTRDNKLAAAKHEKEVVSVIDIRALPTRGSAPRGRKSI